MTKEEAIEVIGEPTSTAARTGIEILRYRLSPGRNIYEEYFVRLVGGKVESYGRVGDFDSTKDPVLDLNIKNR